MNRKHVTFILLMFLSYFTVFAQSGVKITGTVTDSKTGEALIGATVLQKGTQNGVITDFNGDFILTAPENSTLAISYVGYKSTEVKAKSGSPMSIKLAPNDELLDEVVVVGYGSQKLKDLTAPISTVDGSELSKQVASNPMSALQGKMSGVQVINSGTPGATPTVKIRGVGSIGSYSSPLYIVDGAYVDNIDFLNSSDIESLTVLKDASAAAIYGVRAANGVVLITTKKGNIGHVNISYDTYVGYQVPTNVMKLANTEQYVQLINEANANITGYTPISASDYPASVDWYSELLRNAWMTNHSIDVSGATDKTNYSFGVNYFYQDGIMKATNNYNRLNFRGRLDQQVNDWLKLGFNTVISNYSQYSPNNEAFFKAFVSPPTYPVYDETNTDAYPVDFGSPQDYGYATAYANPVAIAYYNNNKTNGFKTVASTYGEISLIKNVLKFKTSYNLDFNASQARNYTPAYLVGGAQGSNKSSLSKTFGINYRHIIDNLLTYTNSFGAHSLNIMLGQSTRIERKYQMTGTGLSVPYEDEQSLYLSLGSATSLSVKDVDSDDKTYTYGYNGLSYFTRMSYNYKEKYLATITFRADGSSKYQEKWGYFPSIGFGWVMTDENFMKQQQFFDFLKLRASWGLLGNDNIPANSSTILGSTGMGSSAVFGDDNVYEGVGAQTVVQNILKWETVGEWNGGFDFQLKSLNIDGSLDYYNRRTYNAVFYAPITSGGGTATLLGNWGTIQNQGVELNLNWKKQISKDFSLNASLNASTIDNKVLSLNGEREFIPDGSVRGSYTTRTAVGHAIGSFYGYEIVGVYASEGDALRDPVNQAIKDAGYFKYKDQNGDNVINDEDKVYLGSAIPWLMGGISFGGNYKKIDFSIDLQGQFGNKILNAKRMNRDVFTDGNYDYDFYVNRWTSDNKSNTYPSAEAYNKAYTQQANTFFVEDGSYIRIQNIQVGYNLENLGLIKTMRIYVSAQRPFTYFTYKGFSPEVSGDPTVSGIDTNTYPMQAIYTAGLKVNF